MIVVTGAAGFIGSNVVAHLLERGRGPVAAVDWLGDGDKWRNLSHHAVAAYAAPEETLQLLDSLGPGVDAIVHMGAISDTTERDVDRLVRLNLTSSVALWDWCSANRVPFIYASSAAVYGARESGFHDSEDPEEIAALRPLNPYAWTKKAVDGIFASRAAAGEPTPPQWVGLRFFNVYGPNEYHKGEMRSVALKLFEAARAGRPLRLFKSHRAGVADGEQKRDFVSVGDCASAVAWYLDHPEISGIFNIGAGAARSFLDVLRALERALDRRLPVEFVDMPEALRTQYQYFTEADMTKARGCGLDIPFTPLEKGVEAYVREHLLKDDPYR